MASNEVLIRGVPGSKAKIRSPVWVVVWSVLTLGIYSWFWWYFINREMRDFGRARGTDLGQNPGNSVLALTPGALVIVPAIVTLWRTCDRIQRTEEVAVQLTRSALGAPVADVMSTHPVTVDGGTDLAVATELMTSSAIKSLPVVEHGRVVGVISRRDVIRVLARGHAGKLLGRGVVLRALNEQRQQVFRPGHSIA